MDEVAGLGDLYALLGVTWEATEKEINKAYRKKSLTCHPDRNKDDPKAAEKFDKLTRGKDFLMNPSKRRLYDEKRKAEEARLRRFKKMDAKSQSLRKDLERREEAARKAEEKAREKLLPKASTDIKQDFERLVKERSARKQTRQDEIDRKMRREISRHARITLILRCDEVTRSRLGIRLPELLKPFRLIKADIEEYSAELLFDCREDALEAVIYLKKEKDKLAFFKKAILEDDEIRESVEEIVDEFEKIRRSIPTETKNAMEEERDYLSGIKRPKATADLFEDKISSPAPKRFSADTQAATTSEDLLAELDAMMQ